MVLWGHGSAHHCFPWLGATAEPSWGSVWGCHARVGISDTSGCCSLHPAGTPSIARTPKGHDGPGCPRLLPSLGPVSGIPPMILFNKHFCLCSSPSLGSPGWGERVPGVPRTSLRVSLGGVWNGASSSCAGRQHCGPMAWGLAGLPRAPRPPGSGGQWADPHMRDWHGGRLWGPFPRQGWGHGPHGCPHWCTALLPWVSQLHRCGREGQGRVRPTCAGPRHDLEHLWNGKNWHSGGQRAPSRELPVPSQTPALLAKVRRELSSASVSLACERWHPELGGSRHPNQSRTVSASAGPVVAKEDPELGRQLGVVAPG